jgi:methionyl-tRNA formyltransferase
MNLVFMGSPAFAVPIVKRLIEAGHSISCVYCQPPRPAGRGQKETLTPVHALALQYNIPVRTPLSLKSPETQAEFAALNADAAIVAAYGLLLPPAILAAYPYGCINIHPSLLPRWRGAAPIHRPLLAGDKETGVAIMQMDKGLDTGDVLAMEKLTLAENTSYATLHDELAEKGAELLLSTLEGLQAGTITPRAQSAEGITYAAKLTKEEGRIDWNCPASVIDRQIRAFTPWPGAWFNHQGESFKITKATYDMASSNAIAGTVVDDTLTIACGDGVLHPLIIQRQGKKPMEVSEFLRGFTLAKDTLLGDENDSPNAAMHS